MGAELGLDALNLGSPKLQIMENSCFANCIACVGDGEHQGVNIGIGCQFLNDVIGKMEEGKIKQMH